MIGTDNGKPCHGFHFLVFIQAGQLSQIDTIWSQGMACKLVNLHHKDYITLRSNFRYWKAERTHCYYDDKG